MYELHSPSEGELHRWDSNEFQLHGNFSHEHRWCVHTVSIADIVHPFCTCCRACRSHCKLYRNYLSHVQYILVCLMCLVPSAPLNLIGENETNSTIDLAWDVPAVCGDTVDSYNVTFNGRTISTGSSTLTFQLMDLAAFTNYTITITAINMIDAGKASNATIVQTLENCKLKSTTNALIRIHSMHNRIQSSSMCSSCIYSTLRASGSYRSCFDCYIRWTTLEPT